MEHNLVEAICDKISEYNGSFDTWVDYEDRTFNIKGSIEYQGYVEDDYFNGTGAFVQTGVNLDVKITEYSEDEITWAEICPCDVIEYYLKNY